MRLSRHWVFIAVPLVVCFAIAALFIFGYRGVSDSENVEIIQSEASPNGLTAMLVRRSDHVALSGDTYFVFVDDHSYSIPQLRKNLYSFHPVFRAGRSGVTIHWSGQKELAIQCHDCGITKDIFEKQEFSRNGVDIRYIDFP